MKFTASRLSEGNKIFPSEIYLDQNGITINIPGLFSGETKQFDFNHIASVEIDTPLIGYSTITIFAGGTKMSAHGFTKAEAKEIKKGIEEGKLDSKKSRNRETFSKSHLTGSEHSSVADELRKMKELLDGGVITQREFDSQKEKILNY
jgi:Short C-terminal domain